MIEKFVKFSVLLCVLVLFQGCTKDDVDPTPVEEEEMEEDDTIYFSGDVIILDTLETESMQKVIIEPGAHITFGPDGILIANGNLIIEGTDSEPIYITGSQDRVSHRVIQVR